MQAKRVSARAARVAQAVVLVQKTVLKNHDDTEIEEEIRKKRIKGTGSQVQVRKAKDKDDDENDYNKFKYPTTQN